MKHKWKVAAASLLAVSMAMTGCSSRDDGSSDGDKNQGSDTTAGEASGAFINPDEDCDDYQGTQGVEGDTIKIGTIRPAPGTPNYGIYDNVTRGAEAYFNAANAAGGVEAGDGKKYKIELIKKDDAYDPAKTPAVARELVEQDGVFAIVGQVGTEPAKAIRDYMNEKCVPNIGLATGSSEWGKANEYPWYIAALPAYATEAHAWVNYLKTAAPNAKVALLYQNDDFGEAYKGSFEREIEGTDIKIVATESFNAIGNLSPEAQVVALSQKSADVFIVGIGGSACPKALSFIPDTWKPMTFISVTCGAKIAMLLSGGHDQGVYLAQATYDPADPADADQPSIVEFREQGKIGGLSDDDISNGLAAPGWGFASLFALGLKEAKTVDRASVMNALFSLKDAQFGMLREGITINTDGAKDPWVVEGFRISQREGEGWVEKAPVENWEGQSNKFADLKD
ncbi:MAG: ABC transporter substrate-binding protein [Microthrixaceae bacterium]|nr:ABC transporter substrate-binding protein [Microthrixaceae bacterium]